MNIKRIFLPLLTLGLLAAFVVSACAPAVRAVPASSNNVPQAAANPLKVVRQYYEALQAKDLDKAMTFAADDIIVTDTTGYYYGKEEVKAAIQRGWNAGQAIEESDFKVNGTRVTSCYKYYENGTLLDQSCNNVTHVRNGKIVFDGLQSLESLFVVQQFYSALNAKDVDTAMSWVAPDAVFANPTGKYEGQAEIRASLESQTKDGITFELSKFHMIASRVIYSYRVMQGNQLLDSGTDGLDIVKNGLIVFDGTERTEQK